MSETAINILSDSCIDCGGLFIFYSNEFFGLTYTSIEFVFSDHNMVIWCGKLQ